MSTLEGMGARDVVVYKDKMNVIHGMLVFNCKHFTNGTVKRFQVCFCACGDQQIEGTDFFESYIPVI